jgi:HAD superfamily hydrolase (TIGR01457 family)
VAERYDALLIDLDGVVYRGDEVIPGAEALRQVRRMGPQIMFLTNNSSRSPAQVADKLTRLGVQAAPEEVLTSGVATATMLRREGFGGGSAFVVGEMGLREALTGAGIRILEGQPPATELVVVGWDRSVDYEKLRTASLLVQRGARLVATNADASYPAPDGLWPGAGAILSAITATTGAAPTVVGKPNRPMFDAAIELTRAKAPLVVGDRLDTDVAGAMAMGWDSLLVFSGAADPSELMRSDQIPTYVANNLTGLLGHPPAGRFRAATAHDANAIGALLRSTGLSDEGLLERFRFTTVCDDADGLPAATACLEAADGYGILRSVAVRENARGKGLGMLAVAAAARQAKALGIVHVSLFTEWAEHFFERLGFRKLTRGELPEPVRNRRHAAMECAASATPMAITIA